MLNEMYRKFDDFVIRKAVIKELDDGCKIIDVDMANKQNFIYYGVIAPYVLAGGMFGIAWTFNEVKEKVDKKDIKQSNYSEEG